MCSVSPKPGFPLPSVTRPSTAGGLPALDAARERAARVALARHGRGWHGRPRRKSRRSLRVRGPADRREHGRRREGVSGMGGGGAPWRAGDRGGPRPWAVEPITGELAAVEMPFAREYVRQSCSCSPAAARRGRSYRRWWPRGARRASRHRSPPRISTALPGARRSASAMKCVTPAAAMAGKARNQQLLAQTKQMAARVRRALCPRAGVARRPETHPDSEAHGRAECRGRRCAGQGEGRPKVDSRARHVARTNRDTPTDSGEIDTTKRHHYRPPRAAVFNRRQQRGTSGRRPVP
jgi:hypothetical protein